MKPSRVNVSLPELGEGIHQAVVAHWHYAVGDHIPAGEDLVELVTDKASFNVSCEAEGIMAEIKYPIGQKANIGDILAVIEPGTSDHE